MSQRSRHEHHEEAVEESDSNWIVSYADMMTLLVGFFALLYSFAQVDKAKFEKIRQAVSESFGGQFETPFEDLQQALLNMIEKSADLKDKVRVMRDGDTLAIIFQGEVFFDSGSAEIRGDAKGTLDGVIGIIKEKAVGYPIHVEGHSDDAPIATALYPSNWELSGGRASRVVRELEAQGVARSLLSAQGYSDTKPVNPNRDEAGNPIPENMAQNRRVIIKVQQQ